MPNLGKFLILGGAALVALGFLVILLDRLGLRLGRLPGDIAVERPGFGLYFPITTMLLLSGLISLGFWIVGSLRK